jgi:arsenate reductase
VITVLFACVHNAGRSQMAAAWFALLADPAKAHARSAGTRPAARVHPVVVEAMREVGVDLEHATPTALADALDPPPTVLITMGCEEDCPFVPGASREDWPLEDPKDASLARVRDVRDDIRDRVTSWLVARGIAKR